MALAIYKLNYRNIDKLSTKYIQKPVEIMYLYIYIYINIRTIIDIYIFNKTVNMLYEPQTGFFN